MTQPQQKRYEWEDDAIANMDASCGAYEIIGVAVANVETGEACFIDYSHFFSGVERADYMLDVHGDVGAVYGYCVGKMAETKGTKK